MSALHEGKHSTTTYSPGYTMETIQCSFGIVEMSTPPEVLWLMCISGKWHITIDDCTNTDDDGNLNCTGSIEDGDAESSGSDDDTTPTTQPDLTSECMPVTSNSEPIPCSCSSQSTVVVVLGTMVALLLALLTLTTVCLAWTCWSMKKRQGVNISKRDR